MKLQNRNAIITGANQGLGIVIAEEFLKEGASIAICARDKKKLEEAVKHLNNLKNENQKIFSKKVDVSVESEIIDFINDCRNDFEKIDILVNNAGIYGPKGDLEDVDSNSWIKAIEINLFGVLYCCKSVIPLMKNNNYGKIINLSGGGATSPLPKISAYAASKAAVVRLTETLSEECKEFNIDINAIAPGALNTRLLDEVLEVGPGGVGESFYNKALKQKESGGAPLIKGASLAVFLASNASDGITGKLISAVWDPWEKLSEYKDELKNTDIYTLRRIIPEDRNKEF